MKTLYKIKTEVVKTQGVEQYKATIYAVIYGAGAAVRDIRAIVKVTRWSPEGAANEAKRRFYRMYEGDLV